MPLQLELDAVRHFSALLACVFSDGLASTKPREVETPPGVIGQLPACARRRIARLRKGAWRGHGKCTRKRKRRPHGHDAPNRSRKMQPGGTNRVAPDAKTQVDIYRRMIRV